VREDGHGSGKTLVMAMVIAWQILNRAANPQDARFSKHVSALDEWTRAVTEHGGFGRWTWKVSRRPGDLLDLVTAATRVDEITTRA
jgi:type III restriction enzyme